MYLTHFGFQKLPFSNAPDTDCYFDAPGHQAALNTLVMALRSGESMLKITGKSGAGKTLLCGRLADLIKDEFTPVVIEVPLHGAAALPGLVASKLGIRSDDTTSQHILPGRVETQLRKLHAKGQPAVLLVDEAQMFPETGLDMLRLLTNLNRDGSTLLSVVLFGTPELDRKLEVPSLSAIKQRIAFACELEFLQRTEFEAYLQHRLNRAGESDMHTFTRGAFEPLYRASCGIPRLINTLAHKSLMAAYGSGARCVQASHVRQAISDTDSVAIPEPLKKALACTSMATLVTFAAIGMYLTLRLIQ